MRKTVCTCGATVDWLSSGMAAHLDARNPVTGKDMNWCTEMQRADGSAVFTSDTVPEQALETAKAPEQKPRPKVECPTCEASVSITEEGKYASHARFVGKRLLKCPMAGTFYKPRLVQQRS